MEGEIVAVTANNEAEKAVARPGKFSDSVARPGKFSDSDVAAAEGQEEEKTPELERFLRFQLGGEDIALLPTEGVLQVVQIKMEDILPVPQMPACVMGVYNWRGDMLWLVDFQHLVGLQPLFSEGARSLGQAKIAAAMLPEPRAQNLTNCMTVVVKLNNKLMGLVVDRVEDIEERDRNQMQPLAAGLFSSELVEFLQGYFVTKENKMLMVFEGEAIVNTPLLQRV